MIGKIWEKNIMIALNVLYAKNGKIYPAYFLKHNSERKEQVILLLFPNGERWHYTVVKMFPTLLRGITSKHNGDECYLNCFRSFRTKNELESYIKVCE